MKLEKKYDIPKFQSQSVSEKEKEISGNAADAGVPSAPMTPIPPSQAVGKTQPPPPDHVVDFRPTTPGHSPGVGHSIQN